jgi:hypothetical protein
VLSDTAIRALKPTIKSCNRTTFLEQHRETLQTCADFLDALRTNGSNVNDQFKALKAA